MFHPRMVDNTLLQFEVLWMNYKHVAVVEKRTETNLEMLFHPQSAERKHTFMSRQIWVNYILNFVFFGKTLHSVA